MSRFIRLYGLVVAVVQINDYSVRSSILHTIVFDVFGIQSRDLCRDCSKLIDNFLLAYAQNTS